MVPSKNKKEIYEDIKKINLNLKKKYNVKETNLGYELDPLILNKNVEDLMIKKNINPNDCFKKVSFDSAQKVF
jgi:hypothetical protein